LLGSDTGEKEEDDEKEGYTITAPSLESHSTLPPLPYIVVDDIEEDLRRGPF